MITLILRGFEAAIAALNLDVKTQLQGAVRTTTEKLKRYGASITPVDTGSMKASWRTEFGELWGRMFIDPAATNTRSGALVSSYAPIVDQRVDLLGSVIVQFDRIGAEGLEVVGWR